MDNNTSNTADFIKPKTSFWDLLKKYKIEIPTIQRDYVQGSKEAGKKLIPNLFAENLYNTLNDEKQLGLEFIYGYSKDNKLILLDGQQRITTLFLLHFYLMVIKILPRKKKWAELWKKEMAPLLNFSYATRSNTRDFCKNLIENPCKYNVKGTEETLSSQITNKSWFNFPEDDPTISSMLNMLDIIQKKFDGKNFIDKLTSENCPITFNFLETKELGNQEDLYIKMNSRGKQLTRYEIFKSRLTTYLSDEAEKKKDETEKAKSEKKNFEEDLDNKYQNVLFWQFAKTSSNPILCMDNMQCNFFEHITWLLYNGNSQKEEEIDEFFLLNNAENVYKGKQDNILSLRGILEGFYQFQKTYNEKNEIDKKISATFSDIISINLDDKNEDDNQDKKHYYARLKLYSLLLFFADFFKNGYNWSDKTTPKETKRKWQDSELTKWFRVCHNLIENTLTDNQESFQKGLASIKQLWTAFIAYKQQTQKDFYDFYDSYKPENISYFSKEQIAEEKLKIEIIKNSLGLSEEDFISHESQPYLKSKIGFILQYSYDNTSGKYDKTKFEKYFEKLDKLFQPTNSKTPEQETLSLFRKALLTKGDYLISIKRRHSFCTFAANPRDKQDTWNKLFNNINKSTLLKDLLDDQLLNKVTEENLQKICDNYINNFNEQKDFYKDWRYLFIKENKDFFGKNWPELRLGNNNIFFQAPNAKSDWVNKGEIYVYAFIKWCKQNNKTIWEYSFSPNPYAWIKKEIKGEAYQFHLRYNGSKFLINCLKDKTNNTLVTAEVAPQLFPQLYKDIDAEIQKIKMQLTK